MYKSHHKHNHMNQQYSIISQNKDICLVSVFTHTHTHKHALHTRARMQPTYILPTKDKRTPPLFELNNTHKKTHTI